nr:DNA ligase [Salinarchaeum laminariae]
MEFEAFADRAREIEATDADLDVISLTAALFDAADDDLAVVARFVQGRVFPAWQSRTHDIGPSRCYAALARAATPGVSAVTIEDRLAERGDIGDVAASLDLGGQTGLDAFASGGGDGSGVDGAGGGAPSDGADAAEVTDGRTVAEIFAEFDAIADASGSGSEEAKEDRLFALFSNSSPEEARYLARLVLGEMRIGVGQGAVRDAIAEAFDVPVDAVSRALQVTNDYGLVAERAREGGESGLAELGLEVGRPVQAMLAQAGTVTDALEEWEEALVETKLDGARVQIHVAAPDDPNTATLDGQSERDATEENGTHRADSGPEPRVRLFSRNMEEVTDALPEIVEFVAAHCDGPAILDGEVVAVDEEGDPLPFQEILRRFRRKHDVAAARENVATELHVFDCLHVPRRVHEELGFDAVPTGASDGGDSAADAVVSDGTDRDDDQAGLDSWADDQPADPAPDEHSRSSDGPGVDLLDAPLSARRTYLEAVMEPGVVDAIVTDDAEAIESLEQDALAAGHEGIMLKNPEAAYTPGRRGKDWRKRKPDVETLDLVVTGAEWGEGRRASLLGTYELCAPTDDGYATVGNVATGITDEELAELHELLQPHVLSETGQSVEIEPAIVFEVGYEEIQRSPTYDSGYALRFPRFVTVREDLDPDAADTLERVERLAEEQ